ncbi:MAG: hypothetical protein ABSA59_08540 [Terriglobia bacterium]|jgi:hypothetical protein
MKLVIPQTGELQAADARLIRLAEFLGIHCDPLRLDKQVQQRAEYIERAAPDRNSCLVINPRVMREWVGGDVLPAELVSCLVSRFPHVLVHALTLDPFVAGMIATLSSGKLQSVQPIADAGQPYEISSNSKDFCGPFSGLSFGPINAANDRVLAVSTDDSTARKLICIGGRPLMAAMKRDKTEILFLAIEDTADVNAQVGRAPLSDYFSQLMPHAMALRHIFGEACWHPGRPHASIIIDDPLLRRDYGFLNFETLLSLMEQYNFHTTIAFIPHNYRRNSARVVRMFRENANRLSICFHGNDHTAAELASTDTALLNTMLGIAEERMKVHEQTTGLCCDRMMVFPQGVFSVEAMEVLKSRNFHAAVNTVPHPMGQPVPLTIADLTQPAVLRYGGFPLFMRTYVKETQSQDIAFNLFFGRPALIVEHHDIFEHPEFLGEVVQKVNLVAPAISWSNLESAVDNSILKRRTPDGTVQVRAYSSNVRIANHSASVERFSIAWGQPGQHSPFDHVLRDGTRFPGVEVNDTGIRVLAELAPGTSQTFSAVYRNGHATHGSLGFWWDAKAFLRRRLCEVRDNYLSKNQHVLTAAKTLQRRFLN